MRTFESVSLLLINELGFVFHRYDAASLLGKGHEESARKLKDYIESMISIENEELFYDVDTIEKGEEILPHFHVINGSFQVVIWLPDDEFLGRDFLYGESKALENYHPEKGMMCFMKPNDPCFFHGVTRLESEMAVETIGFSSLKSKDDIPLQKDIFLESN
ncbi:MAG: hypothetical protein HN576_13145 [Bacteriovoracaceae bacterium]|mgnify:CR=1 FL=1|jgi:hypothetical protein|nr:hypothetical protein [Bacteriovoracaceae bacterium]